MIADMVDWKMLGLALLLIAGFVGGFYVFIRIVESVIEGDE